VYKYLFCFALIRWRASQLQFFFFFYAMSQFWLAHHSNKMKLWRLLKIECIILKCRIPPLWPTCIGEMRTTFVKAYGIKVRCSWELFEEHVRNLRTLSFDHPPPPTKKEKACMESQKWTVAHVRPRTPTHE
jgi:hypothetical protein